MGIVEQSSTSRKSEVGSRKSFMGRLFLSTKTAIYSIRSQKIVWNEYHLDCFGTSDFRLMTSDWAQSAPTNPNLFYHTFSRLSTLFSKLKSQNSKLKSQYFKRHTPRRSGAHAFGDRMKKRETSDEKGGIGAGRRRSVPHCNAIIIPFPKMNLKIIKIFCKEKQANLKK